VNSRHQDGYLFRKGNIWYLRYREDVVQQDGTLKHIQRCRRLVDYGGEYRSKKAVKALADEFLMPLRNGTITPYGTVTLTRFVEDRYLPFVETHKRPSTHAGYRNMWKRYLKHHGEIALRDFRTVEGEEILNSIAGTEDLSRTTMAHIKAFLSGVFRHAKRQGVINTENPMRDVILPKVRPAGETYAYSLEEIRLGLSVLPEPAATVVATAAYTGVREGELRGLLWENYDGTEVRITQSVWRGHIQEPKTKASIAPVPVITPLAEMLDAQRLRSGNPTKGLMFPNTVGKPMCMAKLARDVIRPAFAAGGLQWHGWHAFRRGLATNLHRLGVPDKTIQAILRHANVAVTQSSYIKTVRSDAAEAMQLLEAATRKRT
jgi:integrase